MSYRRKPRLLPGFDVLTTDRSVCATHEAVASGRCAVHTTRAEASSYGLGVASPQMGICLSKNGGVTFEATLITELEITYFFSSKSVNDKRRPNILITGNQNSIAGFVYGACFGSSSDIFGCSSV